MLAAVAVLYAAMGIRFLHKFLERNPDNFKTVKLHKTPIIVDGPNVAFSLYSGALILNQFNGEYLQFAAVVERFLLNLRKCELEPIFVFDGVAPPEKLDTCLGRQIHWHKKLTAFQESWACRNMPAEKTEIPDLNCALVRSTLMAVLRRLRIAFFCADYEADRLIAELAIKMNCPVMSRDSDFFIFSDYWGETASRGDGYCYIETLPFNAQPKPFEGSKLCAACARDVISRQKQTPCCYYLEAKCFAPEQGAFSRLAAPLRPVFAVLWGNDYVPCGYFDSCLPDSVTLKEGSKVGAQKKMANMIEWLSNFGTNLQTPISYVISRFPPGEKQEAEEAFFAGLSLYCIDYTGDLERYATYTGLAAACAKPLTPGSITTSSTTTNTAGREYEERARRVLLGEQGEAVIPDVTEKWPTALTDYFRTHRTFGLFNAVYSFPYFCYTGIQDVRQAEPAEVCARRLRHLVYSVIFNLEKGDSRNLHGVRGPAARPQVCEVKINEEGQPEWIAMQLLSVPITTPARLLKLHFGFPASVPDLRGALHGLACSCFIVLQAVNQDSKELLTTTASSSIILATLAFSVVAFALHETLQAQLLSQDVLLADCIAQHLGRMDCPEAAEASLNFDYLHTYAQLQITYSTLITLSAVLTTTMASMEPVDFGSLDQVMLCFPSGRLAHRLAVRLSLLPQGDRQKEVCEVIFPRLVEEGRRDTPPPCLTQNALSQLTANYARIIAFVDRLLKGRR